MTLFAPILILLLTAAAAPWVSRATGKAGWLLALAPLVALGWLIRQVIGTEPSAEGLYAATRIEWVPTLGVSLAFRLDGLSLIFAILILFIGALILIYAGGYLHGHAKRHRFYGYLLLFMSAMLGLVMAGDLIALFVFWEMTSISSYLLIGFHHEDPASRKKALQALLVTGLGGLALLAGLVLLGMEAGTYEMGAVLAMGDTLRESPYYTAIVLLILGGAFTKSAQVPFHFWLPNAMAAPTPVSAFLHSATMVKAGVYLMARLTPALGGTEFWQNTLIIFGAITMLLGAVLGLGQQDLKRILAYTTLSVLGILTMLLGLGSKLALQAAMLFLIGHALYKAALFMVAGGIDHGTGTRDVQLLRGLRKVMPFTATAALLAALSKSGFPPFFGFLGKEYVYKSGLDLGGWIWIVLVAAVLTNMFLMALALQVGAHPFFGKPTGKTPHHPHEGGVALWMPPLLLALLGLALGIFPAQLERPLLEPAVSAMTGSAVELKVALWQGFNLPLLMSGVTVLGGFGVYAARMRIWKWSGERGSLPWGAERAYEAVMAGIVAFAKWQTRLFQNGQLSNYVRTVLAALMVMLILPLWQWQGSAPNWSDWSWPGVLLVVSMVLGAWLSATSVSRLTALLGLGIVGLGVAIIFIAYSAPDLAITQILVETLTVVLFMFVVYRLPRFRQMSGVAVRVRDAIFAGLVGLFVTLLVIKAQQVQFAHPISDQLAEWSYVEAKGRNVVNVTLVDFRALDTLGEILVLAIAALGVIALVGIRKKSRDDKKEESA